MTSLTLKNRALADASADGARFFPRRPARRATRCAGVAAGLAMSMSVIGCTTPNISKNSASLADQPRADEATELRGWQKSVALYQTGTVQGYPIRFYYTPYPDNETSFNFIADSMMMIVQTITLPPVLLVDYPFRKVYYEGDVLPPTYNAMPPLAPEKPYGPPNPDPDPLTMGAAPLLPPLPPVPVQHPELILPQNAPVITPVPTVRPKTVTPPPAPKATTPAASPTTPRSTPPSAPMAAPRAIPSATPRTTPSATRRTTPSVTPSTTPPAQPTTQPAIPLNK